MHCTNCGAYLAAGARFCAGCGAPAVDPEITRLARPQSAAALLRRDESSDVERAIFTTRPTLLFIKLGYATAVLGAVLLTVFLAIIPGLNVPWYVWLPLALALLLIPAFYHLRRNTIRYTLTDSKLEIDQGLIARTTRNIPVPKIQDVTVSSTMFQRLLGYGNIIVDNAGEQGAMIVLRNISDPRHYADLLLREMRRWH